MTATDRRRSGSPVRRIALEGRDPLWPLAVVVVTFLAVVGSRALPSSDDVTVRSGATTMSAATTTITTATMSTTTRTSGTSATGPADDIDGPAAGQERSATAGAGPRILVIGDSLMFEALPALHRELALVGIEHLIEAHPGSGLSTHHAQVDWHHRAGQLVSDFAPTDVVVEFCCNYWPDYPTDADGVEILPGTPAFEAHWADAATHLRDVLTAGGARLHWVLTPPSAHPGLNASHILPINRTTVAAAAADPDMSTIDWVGPFTDDEGSYGGVLDGEQVRADDGVHFTSAGAERAAAAVMDAIAPARTGGGSRR